MTPHEERRRAFSGTSGRAFSGDSEGRKPLVGFDEISEVHLRRRALPVIYRARVLASPAAAESVVEEHWAGERIEGVASPFPLWLACGRFGSGTRLVLASMRGERIFPRPSDLAGEREPGDLLFARSFVTRFPKCARPKPLPQRLAL
jgi:hypothetical protein